MKTISKLEILKANIINSYQKQTAYFLENWTNVASTFFYTLTLLLFIKIVYKNVNSFASYNESEMLFLILIGQINFYLDWFWSTNNISNLINDVKTGNLDTILIKPIPSLFFVTVKNIPIIIILKDGFPSLILLSFLINWSQLIITPQRALIGFIIFISGQIAWHCFRFLFALPVFFIGQSDQIFRISGMLRETNNIPLEGFPSKLKNIFISIIPSLIAAQMSVSVMLGKSNQYKILILSVTVATIFLILKQIGWSIALKNYSSASS